MVVMSAQLHETEDAESPVLQEAEAVAQVADWAVELAARRLADMLSVAWS
jgi:hypothetical protein